MSAILPVEWGLIPQEAAAANPAAPLASSLRALLTPFGESVTRTHARPAAGATPLGASQSGLCWRFGGASAVEVPGVPYVPPPLTVMVVCTKSNTANEALVSFGGAGAGGGWKFCDTGVAVDGAVVFGGVAQYNGPSGYFVLGQQAVYIVTISATTASFYRDGVLIGTVGVGTPNQPSRPLTVGAAWNSGYADYSASDVSAVSLWGRVATAQEVADISAAVARLWDLRRVRLSGASGAPPAGTVTISAVTPGSVTAQATYSYSAGDADSFEARIDGGTPFAIGASPATITGLSPATTYDLEIRAVNAFGNGDWSDPFEFTTDSLHGFDFDTDPDAPIFGNLVGSPVGIGLLANTNLRMFVHAADTGALVASDVVTTDASAMLARWEDIAINDNTPYRIDFETTETDPLDRSTWSVIMTST